MSQKDIFNRIYNGIIKLIIEKKKKSSNDYWKRFLEQNFQRKYNNEVCVLCREEFKKRNKENNILDRESNFVNQDCRIILNMKFLWNYFNEELKLNFRNLNIISNQ